MQDLDSRIDTETKELVRLQKLYEDVGEKYDKKIEKIKEVRLKVFLNRDS